MARFLLEDKDFKDLWIKIWNAGVSVITRSTFFYAFFFIKFLAKTPVKKIHRVVIIAVDIDLMIKKQLILIIHLLSISHKHSM